MFAAFSPYSKTDSSGYIGGREYPDDQIWSSGWTT